MADCSVTLGLCCYSLWQSITVVSGLLSRQAVCCSVGVAGPVRVRSAATYQGCQAADAWPENKVKTSPLVLESTTALT